MLLTTKHRKFKAIHLSHLASSSKKAGFESCNIRSQLAAGRREMVVTAQDTEPVEEKRQAR